MVFGSQVCVFARGWSGFVLIMGLPDAKKAPYALSKIKPPQLHCDEATDKFTMPSGQETADSLDCHGVCFTSLLHEYICRCFPGSVDRYISVTESTSELYTLSTSAWHILKRCPAKPHIQGVAALEISLRS